MNDLREIAEEIHTINPNFTKETLDLLYEYIVIKYSTNLQKKINSTDLQEVINLVITPPNYTEDNS